MTILRVAWGEGKDACLEVTVMLVGNSERNLTRDLGIAQFYFHPKEIPIIRHAVMFTVRGKVHD